MSYPWFRVYNEFFANIKILKIPEAMRYRLLALYSLRNQTEQIDDDSMAILWRIPMEQVRDTKAVFIENGWIENDWTIPSWDKRQYRSDSSTERVRKHRIETFRKRPMKQPEPVTCNTPDTEADTDTYFPGDYNSRPT